MSQNPTTWIGPYLVRLKKPVGQMPAGSVGTVVEHYADGKAAEVEFTVGTCFDDHEHYVETVEFTDMEDAEMAGDQNPPTVLQTVCSEAYQAVGVLANQLGYWEMKEDDPRHIQITKLMDNLVAAAEGDPIPHGDLLPFRWEEINDAT